MQKVLIGFCVFVFVVLGYVLYTRTSALLVAGFSTNTIETPFYEMKITQPDNALKDFPELFAVTKNAITLFEKNYGNCEGEECDRITPESLPYELQIDTTVATTTKTVSYIVSLYEYTGGAHGITAIKTFTYDKKNKFIDEKAVFGESSWKPLVSNLTFEYLKAKLKDQTSDEVLKEGTSVVGSALDTWYLKDNDVVFVFGQYQVGPYVLGIQEVPIPREKLSEVLTHNFK
ncbi:MAG: RsiV family protein [Candidatus Zambryskibacteria bacterium]|nr:RsiV family protein [Candidatus Zambryskibacteria bacterium]